MSDELRLYDVTVGSHKTRMRLNDRDAAAMGDTAALAADQPAAEPAPAAPAADVKSRLVTSNKMRGTEDRVHPAHGSREGDN